jgi:hypothetical protein
MNARIELALRRLLACAALLGLAAAVRAQTAPGALPSADEVIERFIKVTGGRDAYTKVTSRTVASTLNIPIQKVSGPIIAHSKTPGAMVMTTTLTGIGDIQQGYDGKVGWEKSDLQGVRLLSGDELERTVQLSDPQSELKWKEYYTNVRNTGVEDVGGKRCYKIELTTKGGKPETRYYDVDTGLLVRADMEMDTANGNVKVSATTSDWREVDGGVKLPFKTVQQIKVGSIEVGYDITTNKVETNTKVGDEKFQLPPEVATLAKQKAQPTTRPGN